MRQSRRTDMVSFTQVSQTTTPSHNSCTASRWQCLSSCWNTDHWAMCAWCSPCPVVTEEVHNVHDRHVTKEGTYWRGHLFDTIHRTLYFCKKKQHSYKREYYLNQGANVGNMRAGIADGHVLLLLTRETASKLHHTGTDKICLAIVQERWEKTQVSGVEENYTESEKVGAATGQKWNRIRKSRQA
jgi:hypothetical protein